MKLLATFTAHDVEPDAPDFDYASFRPRTAARAIVFDGDKVALIHVSGYDYYMLPGGGIDNDSILGGLAREIMEELGCSIETTGEVGSVIVYFDRWRKKQTDYCYTARKVGDTKTLARTDFEIEEGHQIVWASSLTHAIQLVKNSTPQNRDGKLVRARDLLFLERMSTQAF